MGDVVRFLHTSDWQLGRAFHFATGDKGARLRALRLEMIDRIGEVARAKSVAFVVVAGDVFEEHTIGNDVVAEACERIRGVGIPVYAIPGNHDFAGAPESVWARPRFEACRPENLHVLSSRTPVAIEDHRTLLLPCPLEERHTVRDPTDWLTDDTGRDVLEDAIRIGIAHGSVTGFESDDDATTPNLIDPSIAERARLDYLALGDWHGLKKISGRVWYSGTPEPDRFKDNRSGHVLIVEIDRPGGAPRIEEIEVAHATWIERSVGLWSDDDVAALERELKGLERPLSTLLKLELEGSLGIAAHERLRAMLDLQSDLLLHCRVTGEVGVVPSESELAELCSSGLTGAVARTLVALAERKNEAEAMIAGRAIQILYRLTRGGGLERKP